MTAETPEQAESRARDARKRLQEQRSQGKDNYGRPRSDYIEKLAALDLEGLYRECKDRIWLSAFANNNPRSDYHWQADACYDECVARLKDDIYSRAYDAVAKG